MKKMPTLFTRVFENGKIVGCTDKVTAGCEWVLNGEGVATQKLDGTCCLVDGDTLFARYDAKKGKPLPPEAVPCQPEPDPITGHWPCWVPVTDQPQYKHHRAAFVRQKPLPSGTYELCGEHFQNDPENIGTDTLMRHGEIVLNDVPRTFKGIRDYVCTHNIEGIVFHRGNGEMCKIKSSDFGVKRAKREDT